MSERICDESGAACVVKCPEDYCYIARVKPLIIKRAGEHLAELVDNFVVAADLTHDAATELKIQLLKVLSPNFG